MSEEVKAAIREHWTSSSSSDESFEANPRTRAKTTQHLQPHKPAFKVLRSSPSLKQTTNRATARTSITDVTSSTKDYQPLFRTSVPSNHTGGEPAAADVSHLECNRPATPRPKVRGTSHILPLRAMSTMASTTGLHMPNNGRHESDHDANKIHEGQIALAKNNESTEGFLHKVDEPLAQSKIRLDNTVVPIQNPEQGSAVKANSGLKLRTPRSTNVQSTPTPSSKKRRISIYDLEVDEEVQESNDEAKRQRPLWQTAANAFGKSRPDINESGSMEEAELTLVPRTPSTTTRKSSVYLPRL